jgi:thiol-disulfide isomerase/thioredoxin
MMNNNIWLSGMLVLLMSCNGEKSMFEVSGNLDNGEGMMIYLKEMTSTEMIPVDSTLIDEVGGFELNGTSPENRFYAIHTLPESFIYILAGKGDKIIIEGDAKALTTSYTLAGSEDSRLIRELTSEQNKMLARIYQLNRIFTDSVHNPNLAEIKEGLDSAYDGILEAHREYTFAFIEDNLHSQASLMALYQQIGPRRYVLDPEEDFAYFAMVDSSLGILYPESDAVQDLHRQVDELKQKQLVESMSAARLEAGTLAPEIALPGPDGDTILLSSLRNHYVLLDFWASWCPPCRRENPNLVKIYEKYHDKGFEIYQVSLDKSRDAWLRAIKDDGLHWIHVSDLKFWNSVVVPVYNIQGIPVSYLLDRQGRILAHNLKGERLEQELKKIFNP